MAMINVMAVIHMPFTSLPLRQNPMHAVNEGKVALLKEYQLYEFVCGKKLKPATVHVE